MTHDPHTTMTHAPHSSPHTTTTDCPGRRAPETERAFARRRSPLRTSDAIVANYLHDISRRRRGSGPHTAD